MARKVVIGGSLLLVSEKALETQPYQVKRCSSRLSFVCARVFATAMTIPL
jgi:hypothetical protein